MAAVFGFKSFFFSDKRSERPFEPGKDLLKNTNSLKDARSAFHFLDAIWMRPSPPEKQRSGGNKLTISDRAEPACGLASLMNRRFEAALRKAARRRKSSNRDDFH